MFDDSEDEEILAKIEESAKKQESASKKQEASSDFFPAQISQPAVEFRGEDVNIGAMDLTAPGSPTHASAPELGSRGAIAQAVILKAEKRFESGGNKGAYMVYGVQSQFYKAIELSDADTKITVWRRYSDFVLIRNYLFAVYPAAILPPLPEKKTNFSGAKIDVAEENFVEKRRVVFQHFVDRILNDVVLSQNSGFHYFLRRDDWRQFLFIEVDGSKSSWDHSTLEDKWKAFTVGIKPNYKNSDIANLQHYSEALEKYLNAILSQHVKITKRLKSFAENSQTMSKIFTDWSKHDAALGELLQDNSTQLSILASHFDERIEQEENCFVDPLKEYTDYSDSLQAVVKKHLLFLKELDEIESNLTSKSSTLNSLQHPETQGSLKKLVPMTPEERQKKIEETSQQISTATKLATDEKAKLQKFHTEVLQNLKAFHIQKMADLKSAFQQYARAQVTYCTKSIDAWQAIRDRASK